MMMNRKDLTSTKEQMHMRGHDEQTPETPDIAEYWNYDQYSHSEEPDSNQDEQETYEAIQKNTSSVSMELQCR
eukprot:8960057-Prorocentrum_lima.AAC.1